MMLSATFTVLSDPTCRPVVERSAPGGAVPVDDLAGRFSASLPAFIGHDDGTAHAGLVERERRGRQVVCHLKDDEMRTTRASLDRNLAFGGPNLDALGLLLDGGGRND